MSNNFFAGPDDENEEFRDVPDEVVEGQQAPVPNVRQNRPTAAPPVAQQAPAPQPQPPAPQYAEEEEITEEEEDFSSILTDARLRLEQGRLYEMLINHNLFEGTDADEKAIKYVQKQIRNFAKEQMEIMLGMRQEVVKQEAPVLTAENFPFNDLEVQALKALARAATGGATEAPEAQTFSGVQEAPKRTGLNPVAVKQAPKPAAIAKPVAKAAPAKPLASKPAQPVKRTRQEVDIERILAEEGISREEYERQYNPNYKPLDKDPTEMDPEELKRRNAQAKVRRAINPNAIPMPTVEQEEMMYTQRAQAAASHPQMQNLMSLLLNQKKK